MRHTRSLIQTLFALLIAISSAYAAHAETKPFPPLSKPPLGDRWFGIFLSGERTGFARQTIAATTDGFEITAEGSVKMVVLGFSREASSRERYLVNRDLSLRSFQVEQVIDGTPMRVAGEATPKGVRVTVEAGGGRKERLLKAKGAVYPPPAMNLYPFMRGAAPGKVFRAQMLDVEGVKVKEVKITVVGVESLPDGNRALHLRNDLFPMVDNDIWVDLAGNTIRESVRDGLVETVAETEQGARRFIADAAISRRDLILDFSLVPVEPPLSNAASISRLVLEIEGIPRSMPLLEGGGQWARRLADGKVVFTVEPGRPNGVPADEAAPKRFLEPTDRLPADHPEIVARAKEVVGEKEAPRKRVEKLVGWVSAHVEDAVTDAPSPLDTLKSRKGNCQAHARLYAALARAAGIPTRFVSGLVHMEGKGLLYHSWAESFVQGSWIQVDPTFGQVPADATHVKLVEGETPDEMAAIAGVVGRIRARVVEAEKRVKRGSE